MGYIFPTKEVFMALLRIVNSPHLYVPRNKSRQIDKLYFVGGSTHPGGGIPLVIQSAFNAIELIERYEG